MAKLSVSLVTIGGVALNLVVALAAIGAEPEGVNWPSFRGPHASGVAEGFKTPQRWSVPKGQNIRWKVPVAGLGHSGPIVWKDRIFLTTAVQAKGQAELKPGLYGDIAPVEADTINRWLVYCFDRTTGKLLWERTAHEDVPRTKRHPKSSHANPTPATDGQHVVAFFGSEGLYCYDLSGNLLWKKDMGLLDAAFYRSPAAQWGFASSPVIHDGLVIVQCDVMKNSFLAALDITDATEVWRTPRDDVPTWATPTIDARADRTQVIVNGYKHIGGYDVRTGKPLWRLSGGGDIPVPTPVVKHGLIYITSAHGRQSPIYAVRVDATGDITLAGTETTNEHIAWSHRRRGNYMQTPIVYGKHVYLCSDSGVMSCLDAGTGRYLYRHRLGVGAGFTASPVAADGKIYLTAESGEVVVVAAGPKYEVIAVNDLGETCLATPAISQGELFFRTRHHLVAVSDRGMPN